VGPDNSGVYFLYADQATQKSASTRSMAPLRKLPITSLPLSVLTVAALFFGPHGLIATTYGRPDNPGDVAINNLGAMKVLTSLNQELLAQKKPGHVEEIWYQSSKDNRKIQGWIIHPPDFDQRKNILSSSRFTWPVRRLRRPL